MDELKMWAIVYTAFGFGPCQLLPLGFETFERIGPVAPPDNRDAAIFQVSFNGKWACCCFRDRASLKSNIWISFSPDMKAWGWHQVLFYAREGGWWDAYKIGLSPQPMYTPEGWLIMYHGVRQTTSKIS